MASSTRGSQKALQSLRHYALHTLRQWVTRIPGLHGRTRHHQTGTRGWSLPSIAGLTSKRHLCSEEPRALGSHSSPWHWSTPTGPCHRRAGWKPSPGACCLATCQDCSGSSMGQRYHITTPEGLITTEKLSAVLKVPTIFPTYTSCT